jgi:hypothetical protein
LIFLTRFNFKDTAINKPIAINSSSQSKKITLVPQINKSANSSKLGPSVVVESSKFKIESNQNYSISDLKSSDETDDEDMPSKRVPDWATSPKLTRTALAYFTINYKSFNLNKTKNIQVKFFLMHITLCIDRQ